jgi:hypothetical protein
MYNAGGGSFSLVIVAVEDLKGSMHGKGKGSLRPPALYRSIFSQVCKVFGGMSLRKRTVALLTAISLSSPSRIRRIFRGHTYIVEENDSPGLPLFLIYLEALWKIQVLRMLRE